MVGALELAVAKPPAEYETVLKWPTPSAKERWLSANATLALTRVARGNGAEGIGLCRTEHMFLAPDRLPIVRHDPCEYAKERGGALEQLRIVQQADFEDILKAMDGLPVTIRLLDPPLHEFLPSVEELRVKEAKKGLRSERELLDAAESWAEHNPMIGTRGVRLGVIKPGLYAMQVRALLDAAKKLHAKGGNPVVEVMIPLTVTREELGLARSWVQAEIDAALKGMRGKPKITIGTMIETPRAAVRADEIAEEADFFSFGTNDLTLLVRFQSRRCRESNDAGILEQGLLKRNPFDTIDQSGVGDLVKMGAERGRSVKPALKLGVCGEHGGDPESIELFSRVGLDYVSARHSACRSLVFFCASDHRCERQPKVI